MADQGIFIALEGVDGSGKGTQFRLLTERLRAVGYDVETFDFPRYDEPSSHFVRRYLNGEYGPASEISPYSAALFYALDRFEAAPEIRQALSEGKIVLSNRYTGSSMAHQGSKFGTEAEQRGFFIWVESLEYQLLNIPRPNVSIFLRVPAEISYELIEQKAKRGYTAKKRDEHEGNFDHLQRSVAAYDTLCRLFPKDFLAIECSAGDKILDIPTINDSIWQTLRYFLPPKPPHRGRSTIVKLGEPQSAPAKARAPEVVSSTDKKTNLSLLALIELAKYSDTEFQAEQANPASLKDYYTPPGLLDKDQKRYRTAMSGLFEQRQSLQAKLTGKKTGAGEIIKALTPMAVKAAVDVSATGLAKAGKTAKLAELRSLAKTDSGRVVARTSITKLEQLLEDKMNPNQSVNLEPLTLLEAWPRNEFEILGSGLYGLSDLPRQEIQTELENWTYEQKYQALADFLAQIDASVAAQVRYQWDVIAPQSLLIELAGTAILQNLQVQTPTPRYGYEVPAYLEESALSDDFIDCFDLSLKLYSELQASGREDLAPYATLAGHKARFQFTCNLDDLIRLGGNDSMPIQRFRNGLIDKLSENHPIIADFLRSMNSNRPAKQPPKPRRNRHRRPKK